MSEPDLEALVGELDTDARYKLYRLIDDQLKKEAGPPLNSLEMQQSLRALEPSNPTRVQGTCLTCRFSGQELQDEEGENWGPDDDRHIEPTEVTLTCRRFPPVLRKGEHKRKPPDLWRQPLVYTNDVCGEWQPS